MKSIHTFIHSFSKTPSLPLVLEIALFQSLPKIHDMTIIEDSNEDRFINW